MPTLIHDGRAIIESTLICEYLDDTFPEPGLVPVEPYRRARMRLWSKHIDEGVFEATREISFSAMFREKMKSMTEQQRNGRFENIGDPGRRARFLSTYQEGVQSPFVAQGIFAFEKLFEAMEAELGDGRPWLVGDRFSLAEVNVMPFVARLDYLGLGDVWLDDRPLVRSWWNRARSRPSFAGAIAAALNEEQLTSMRQSGARIKADIALVRERQVHRA